MEKSNRNNRAIELIRSFAIIIIFIGHLLERFVGVGSQTSHFFGIYVEFFFMISGFFMMAHIQNSHNENESSWDYTLHKVKKFWGPLCIVNFSQLFVHCCMSNVNSVGGVFEKLWHFKWEFFLLQCAGFIQNPAFDKDYLVGPTWYLSALVLATIVLYPIAKNYKRIYTNIICPLVMLIAYAGFIQTYGHMNIGNGFKFIVMDAFVRALAGICCGSLCYSAYLCLKEKENSALMVGIDCLGWIMIPMSVIIGLSGIDDSGLFMLIPFGIIIISSMLNRTPVSKALNRIPAKAVTFLGIFSLYIYLSHWVAMFAVMHFMPNLDGPVKVIIAAIITIAYSFVLLLIDKKRKDMKPVLIICLGLFLATLLYCSIAL